eukprot:1193607-Prorocentrum_minimum.AAC.1
MVSPSGICRGGIGHSSGTTLRVFRGNSKRAWSGDCYLRLADLACMVRATFQESSDPGRPLADPLRALYWAPTSSTSGAGQYFSFANAHAVFARP